MTSVRRAAWVWAWVLAGCVAPLDDDGGTDEYRGPGETIVVDDAKADRASEIRVRAEGMTVWLEPELVATGDGFVIAGRASRAVEGTSSATTWPVSGRVVSARRFEIVLARSELLRVAMGEPLVFSVRGRGAPHPSYGLRVRARPRLVATQGAPSSFEPDVMPVWSDGAARYRVLARGSAEVVAELDADALVRALTSSIEVHGALARAELVLREVAITELAPDDAWRPEPCDAALRACLARELRDTSECGDAWSVHRCSMRDETLRARFVDDLRTHLGEWYVVHGRDVRAAGGARLREARANVRLERVEIASEDPLGHDPRDVLVLRHPDVVFPGSDRAWLGAYDRTTAELLEIVDFE